MPPGDVRDGPSGPLRELTSSDVRNLSVVPGATVTDALDAIASGGALTTDAIVNASLVVGASASDALDALLAETIDLADDIDNLSSSDIANDSTVAGSTVTQALDSLAVATGNQNGYSSRNVYNAASSPVTFTTASQIPPGNFFVLHAKGPGGGGAGGAANRTGLNQVNGGGGGGGGAALPPILLSRAALIAGLPIVITLPAGGVGGAGASTTGAEASGTDGLAPTGDLTISFNGVVVYTAFRGGGAAAGESGGGTAGGNGGGGGGLLSAGSSATSAGVRLSPSA